MINRLQQYQVQTRKKIYCKNLQYSKKNVFYSIRCSIFYSKPSSSLKELWKLVSIRQKYRWNFVLSIFDCQRVHGCLLNNLIAYRACKSSVLRQRVHGRRAATTDSGCRTASEHTLWSLDSQWMYAVSLSVATPLQSSMSTSTGSTSPDCSTSGAAFVHYVGLTPRVSEVWGQWLWPRCCRQDVSWHGSGTTLWCCTAALQRHRTILVSSSATWRSSYTVGAAWIVSCLLYTSPSPRD